MSREEKVTTYLAPPEGDIPRNLSIPLVNEENFTYLRTEKPSLLRGPRRVLRLCLFALVIPSILITIPLYVRLVLYPPGHYPMMPTDQRLLNQHVSGIWCQAQSTHMNGSFNAFLSHGFPGVGRERRRHVMLHTMKMRDDVKEYWGFHFLKGSTITISSCARLDGGQLMILRGIENLRRCAWIGEQDSFEDMGEDDDIISEERHKIRDQLMKEEQEKNKPVDENTEENEGTEESPQSPKDENQSEERRKGIAQLLREAIKMSKDKKEILKILHSEGKNHDYIFHGQFFNKELPAENDTNNETSPMSTVAKDAEVDGGGKNNKTTAQLVHRNEENRSTESTIIKDVLGETGHTIMSDSPKAAESKLLKDETRRGRRKRLRENRRKKKGGRRREENLTEEDLPQEEETKSRLKRFAEADGTDGAFEDLDADDIMDILQDPKNDKQLNVSSVEMTVGGQVFFPDGLKFERGRFNQSNLNDHSREEHKSSYSSSEEALASCEGVILTLPLVPYRNCHFGNMAINKIVYDIPITGTYYFVFNSDNEIAVNDFFFNLTMDRVVYDTNASQEVCSNATDCSLPLSFWSNEQTVVEVPQEGTWDHAYVLDTKCEPRVYIYLTLLLLVPLFIMCCAFR